jgi:hypothetical protein
VWTSTIGAVILLAVVYNGDYGALLRAAVGFTLYSLTHSGMWHSMAERGGMSTAAALAEGTGPSRGDTRPAGLIDMGGAGFGRWGWNERRHSEARHYRISTSLPITVERDIYHRFPCACMHDVYLRENTHCSVISFPRASLASPCTAST